MLEGIIVKGIGGFYYVKTAEGMYECKARGVFRKKRIIPTVGDRVKIALQGGKGSIEEISNRKNLLIRPPVANIDMLLIVVAATNPEPSLFLIDKMLITAEKNNIEPVICINKTDLAKRDDIESIYKNAGYRVLSVSAKKEENLTELGDLLIDKVTAFAGLSGVGKSTLLGNITQFNPETGVLSEKINRGKHTTRHVELMELDSGGFVFDTPGFSSMEINDIKAGELQLYFPEIEPVARYCRFKGCSHVKEQDCAVKGKVKAGEISTERYESYCTLYEELKNIKEWK